MRQAPPPHSMPLITGHVLDEMGESGWGSVVLFHLYGVRQLDFCPTAAHARDHADTTFVPQRRGRPLWPT